MRIWAERLRRDLECWRLEVVLVPAPDQHFSSHSIRAAVNVNPAWYRRYWAMTGLKRCHLITALIHLITDPTPFHAGRYDEHARNVCVLAAEMEAASVCRITGDVIEEVA